VAVVVAVVAVQAGERRPARFGLVAAVEVVAWCS